MNRTLRRNNKDYAIIENVHYVPRHNVDTRTILIVISAAKSNVIFYGIHTYNFVGESQATNFYTKFESVFPKVSTKYQRHIYNSLKILK